MFCSPTYRKPEQSGISSPIHYGVKWNHTDTLSRYDIIIPKDIIPLWVADMDVEVSPAIYQALRSVTEHKIFGYSQETAETRELVCHWQKERHQWNTVRPEEIVFSSATITALIFLLYSITNKGDEVIVQQPVYPPLSNCIEAHKRVLKVNTLIKHNTTYSMNIAELESLITKKTKMLILCNPQNPTGRVWQKEELQQVIEVCKKHNIYIFSDDVHADIVYAAHRYVPIASIDTDYADKIITANSIVKAFNIPGLHIAMLHISDAHIRNTFQKMQKACIGHSILSPYAIAAQEAAMKDSLLWLQSLLLALEENRNMLFRYIQEHMPQIRVHNPEGTFVLWLDFSSLQLDEKSLFSTIYTKAKLGLKNGIDFGASGTSHMRLNFACSPQLLKEAMQSLHHTLNTL